jgi:hypothetical protein
MPSAARKPSPRSHPSPARVSVRALPGPLVVSIGRQWDGCTYRLHPLSKRRLKAAHPRIHPVPSLFVGYATRDEFEALHGPMWLQIAQMLTGLGEDKLRALGGLELHDPDDGSRRRIV